MISISLFVVLLATYCYSVPVTKPFDITTPKYEFTTGQTIIDHENKINMHLVTDEESTGLPDMQKVRSVIMNDKDKMENSEHYGEHYDNDKHHGNYDHKTRATEESNEADVQKEERSDAMDKRYRSGEYNRGDHYDNRHDNHGRNDFRVRATEESNEADVQKEERSDPVDKRYLNRQPNRFEHGGSNNYDRNYGSYDHNRHFRREFNETTESTTKNSSYSQPDINQIVSITMDNLSKFLSTTMETKTQFEKKAIPSRELEKEETPLRSERGFYGKEFEHTSTDKDSFVFTSTTDKNVHTDPMEHTSGESFGHMTGLLKTKREEKEETPESKREEKEESESKREEKEETPESKREEKEETPDTKREEKDETPESKREEKDESESKREEKDESESKREEKEETPESKREEKDESESKREEKEESESKREEKEETPDSKREEKEDSESKREEKDETPESKREEKDETPESKREEKEETPESKREKSEAKREEETKFEDRSVEELTTPLIDETTKIVQTETIIPIKIIDTKIIGQKQPVDEKKKSNH